jgi:hypothetical protein
MTMRPLLAILALALSGCLDADQQINDCLPSAIAVKAKMEQSGVPTKILIVRWEEDGKVRGHAYAVFSYGKKKWSYDKDFGSVPLTAPIAANQDPAFWEAWEANYKRGHKGTIRAAYYLQ